MLTNIRHDTEGLECFWRGGALSAQARWFTRVIVQT